MSENIRKIYRKKGLKAPNGKGIHTAAFHKIVVGLKSEDFTGNAYAVAMSKLGRNRAVKKGHRQ